MTARPCIFFDLHGTLGDPPGGDIADFVLYPFAVDALRLLTAHGMAVAILTNQSGVAKGRMSLCQCEGHAARLLSELKSKGCSVGGLYICLHRRADDCGCKKPLPTLARRAAEELGVDLWASYVVGDVGPNDMLLARNIGAKGILVRTGFGERNLGEFRHTWADYEADFIAADALDAVRWILVDLGVAM